MRPTTSALVLVALAGCGDDAPSYSCVANLATDCQPLVDPPTFQAIYDGTLHATCASGTTTCHSSDGAKGGLVFEDPDQSYALLLGMVDGRKRVVPNDPACSLLVERLDATTPTTRMPPGSVPLSAAEQCTIVKWILQGAPR